MRKLAIVIAVVAVVRCGGDNPTQPPGPNAPTSLAAVASSATQINLTWVDNSSDEEAFFIERCSGPGCTSFSQIASAPVNTVGYSNTGLSASTSYTYRVIAYKSGAVPSPSSTATAVTLAATPPPAAPTTLLATPSSGTQVNLTWTDNASTEDGFYVERCSGPGCATFSQIASVAANTASYPNTGLTAGTSYTYRVRAYNTGGTSAYTGTATATPPTAPAAPTGFTATANSSTQINLSWTDASTNEAGFRIDRCSGAACSPTVELITLGANVTSYSNTGLTASTSYTYRVRAQNVGGNSSYTTNQTAVTPSTTPAPAAPTVLGVTIVSGTQLDLAWTDNATTEDGFSIERCSGASCATFAQVATVGVNVKTYQNTGLTAGTSYSYRVRAYNGGGNSGYTNTATATPPTAPAAPTALGGTVASSSQINLSWTDNATTEVGFEVERCTGASCSTFAKIATLGVNVASYNNTSLAASTSYSYRVRAYNLGGNSTYSNTVTAVTSATVTLPLAPTMLTATPVSASQINLAWTDMSSNETGFKVEQCAGATCTGFVQLGTVGPNATSVSITDLAAGTTYRYRIRAYNAAGNSGYSNIVNATTAAAAARTIRIINNVTSSVSLRDIVRLKLEPNEASFGDDDLLSDDRYTSCQHIDWINWIPNGGSATFPETIGNNYSVWIQLGVWQTDFFGCPDPYVWSRLTSFNTGSGLRYAYVIANITGHTSGRVDFRVYGSYLTVPSTLRLEMSQDGYIFADIPFIITP